MIGQPGNPGNLELKDKSQRVGVLLGLLPRQLLCTERYTIKTTCSAEPKAFVNMGVDAAAILEQVPAGTTVVSTVMMVLIVVGEGG